MFFSIDPHNGVAIYDQIVRQIKFAIAAGTVAPGQMLPSVRQLSLQLAINPNTINRAFQQLQQEQIASSMRGIGLVVEPGAREKCIDARKNLIAERLRNVITESLHAGLTARQIEKLVKEQLAELNGNVPTIASVDQS
jgi:GntR family transcriptional regulator